MSGRSCSSYHARLHCQGWAGREGLEATSKWRWLSQHVDATTQASNRNAYSTCTPHKQISVQLYYLAQASCRPSETVTKPSRIERLLPAAISDLSLRQNTDASVLHRHRAGGWQGASRGKALSAKLPPALLVSPGRQDGRVRGDAFQEV